MQTGMNPMAEVLLWRIVLRRSVARSPDLPTAIITAAPPFRTENMPDEIGILLPTNGGPKQLIATVSSAPFLCTRSILGLFLANPFLNVRVDGARLTRSGVRWVANLPSVEQQDEEFSAQLADVELDRRREFENLAQFRAQGFMIAAVVATEAGAEAALAIGPDAIVVMPRVADFAAGFPSLRQRDTAARSVASALRAAGWQGPLLGLGDAREIDSEQLWSASLDGLVCRPVPIRAEPP